MLFNWNVFRSPSVIVHRIEEYQILSKHKQNTYGEEEFCVDTEIVRTLESNKIELLQSQAWISETDKEIFS